MGIPAIPFSWNGCFNKNRATPNPPIFFWFLIVNQAFFRGTPIVRHTPKLEVLLNFGPSANLSRPWGCRLRLRTAATGRAAEGCDQLGEHELRVFINYFRDNQPFSTWGTWTIWCELGWIVQFLNEPYLVRVFLTNRNSFHEKMLSFLEVPHGTTSWWNWECMWPMWISHWAIQAFDHGIAHLLGDYVICQPCPGVTASYRGRSR